MGLMKEYIGNSNIHSFVTVAMNKPKELNRLLEYIEKMICPDLYQLEWIIVTNDLISTSSIPNVSIYEHAQGNISQLRNYGANFAKGEFITFIDVDMIFKQDFLEEIILKLKKVTNKTVLLHYIYAFNVEDTLLNRSTFEKISPMNVGQFLKTYEDVWSDYRKDVFQLYKNDLSTMRAPWVYGWSGAFTCNKFEFKKVKGFDESFNGWGAEDTDLSYRLFLNNNTFIISEKSPVVHYPHASKSKNISKEYFNNRCKLFMKNPAMESELYKYVTGINLNNVLDKLEVTAICSMSPVYAHHDLSAIKSKMKSNNLFIGTDSLGILKQLLPQEILVWSDRFEQVVNDYLPMIKTSKYFGVSTDYKNNYFDCVFLFDAGISIIPTLKKRIFIEASRIGAEVYLIKDPFFNPLEEFKLETMEFVNDEIINIEI